MPGEATHLAVATSNEAGLSLESATAELASDGIHKDSFARHTQLGILGALAPKNTGIARCIARDPAVLERSGIDDVVVSMVRRTADDMLVALRSLARWFRPIVAKLQRCKDASRTAAALDNALVHLETGVLKYQPGVQLDVDGTSLFMAVNVAIGHLRKEQPAAFGMDLGQMLSVLALLPTASTSRNGSSISRSEISISSISSNSPTRGPPPGFGVSAPGDAGAGVAHPAVGSLGAAATGGDAEDDLVASGDGAGIGDGDGAAVGVETSAGEAADVPVLPPEESEGSFAEDVAAQ
mmetsp:Transcript_14052/g.45464  ORF Transcript_14052/g.45464 Transcript_14052/m.45464 type:complete len:295 (-) Transcript_14052:283-1167(-)